MEFFQTGCLREVFCWKKSSKKPEVERLRKRPATLPRPIELPQVCPAVIMSQVVWLRESPPQWLNQTRESLTKIKGIHPIIKGIINQKKCLKNSGVRNWMGMPRNVIFKWSTQPKWSCNFWGIFVFPVFTSIKNKRDQMVRVGNDDSPTGQLTVVPSQLTLRRGRGTPEPDFWQMDEA